MNPFIPQLVLVLVFITAIESKLGQRSSANLTTAFVFIEMSKGAEENRKSKGGRDLTCSLLDS